MGFSWGAGGSGTFNEGNVMVNCQERDKLEIRPKMGGQGLKLGGGWGGGGVHSRMGFRVILEPLEEALVALWVQG